MTDRDRSPRVLIAGATGYIGGRLMSSLEGKGIPLRCIARRPDFLRSRAAPSTEIVPGDVLDLDSLRSALSGIDSAYYLVHSLGAVDFEAVDREGALNFAKAAAEAGVKRLIYLGGLGEGDDLSPHLRSRQEVGRILRESGVTTIEFRASIVIGSGSLSFEMIRALIDRLPLMITPRWVRVRAQPVAVEDVVEYLVQAREVPLDESIVVEIGGPDRITYAQIMMEYARQRGLRRLMIPVPVLTPHLSSLWLGLVTPLYATVGRKLIESIIHETLVRDELARRLFTVKPRGYKEAIRRALLNEDREFAETRWSDAPSARGDQPAWGGVRTGSRLVDSRRLTIDRSPEAAFAPIKRIGGKKGWYSPAWPWRFRGLIDLLVGGAGMRRGRRHPEQLAVGDTVDFWRVEAYEEDHLLRLSAEMKLPGRAWLQFEVEPAANGSTLTQTAIFDPLGLPGLLYWYALWPVHSLIFGGMIKGITRASRRKAMRRC
ncbi:MAG: SDR family oxidoreductase [Chloroflexota bacterium]